MLILAIGVFHHSLDKLLLDPPHPHSFLLPYTRCPDGQGASSSVISGLHPVRQHDVRKDSISNDD